MNYGSLQPNYTIVSQNDSISSRNFHSRLEDEHMPLIALSIRQRRYRESILNLKVLFLVVIFIFGVSIGIYLLLVEYNELPPNYPYYLIKLEEWYDGELSESVFVNKTTMQLPINNIIISQARDDHKCYNFKTCSKILNEMIEIDLFDIPYNFVISSIGVSYEIRGWSHASEFKNNIMNNQSIIVGFIGSNKSQSKHLAEFKAFIAEALKRRQLTNNFDVYGIESRIFDDFNSIIQWKGFK